FTEKLQNITTERLAMWQRIELHDEIISTLYLRIHTDEIRAEQQQKLLMLNPVMLMAGAIAIVFSTLVARQVAKPLAHLRRTAAEVVDSDNYAIRAERLGDDEVGQVVDAFNRMLEKVQAEDASLRESEEKFRLI